MTALCLSFVNLYVAFFLQVQTNPGFDYVHAKQYNVQSEVAALIVFAVLLIYYIIYGLCVYTNRREVLRSSASKLTIFISSQMIHAVIVLTVLAGVYNRHFSNGGV